MRQRVFTADRDLSWLAVILSGGFGLIGLVVGVSAIIGTIRDPENLGAAVFFAVFGFALAMPFVWFGVRELVDSRAAQLVLARDGFDVAGIVTPWTDVEGFDVAGSDDRAYVTVRYAPDVRLTTHARISIALSRLRLYIPPAFIPTHFETGGHPLLDILRDALWHFRNPQDEQAVRDVRALAESTGSTTELYLPLKRSAVARDIVLSAVAVTFVAVLGPTIWLSRTPDRDPGVELVLGLVGSILWLTLLAPLSVMLWHSARRARIGGLRLDSVGFEYGGNRWAWADLASIEPGIRVIYRPDCLTIPAPSSTGIHPAYLDAGDEPLVDVLRRWHAPHRPKSSATNGIRHAPDNDVPVGDQLIIPIKWWRVLSRSLYSFGVLVILLAGMLSYLFTSGAHLGVVVALCLAFSSLFVIGAAMFAYDDLRTIRARCLRLDPDGFTFGRHRWRWTDIENLYTSREDDGEGGTILRIAVVYRAGSSTTAPGRTPINPPDFSTGGRPLEDVLRGWLRRYGR